MARGVNWSALVHVQDWNLPTTDQVKLKYQDCAKKYLKTDFCKGFYGLKKWESFLKGQISISNRHRAPPDASKVEVGYWYILVSLKSTFWIKDRLKISSNYCQFLEDTVFKQVQEKIWICQEESGFYGGQCSIAKRWKNNDTVPCLTSPKILSRTDRLYEWKADDWKKTEKKGLLYWSQMLF